MWFNGGGGGDINAINMNSPMNPTITSNMNMNANFINQMVSNFNPPNNHDVFDFSSHSNSMQQGTESSSNAVSVSSKCVCFSF